ncbi:MAG TPA: hypothetical protein VKA63_03910 [Candidatus Krumholzibacteria bacterium]|nr:hypothetical protein [Candidatus Krumholzibacteria bacterium]
MPIPVALPFKLLETYYGSGLQRCAFALFDYTGWEDVSFGCGAIPTQTTSWGALKATY